MKVLLITSLYPRHKDQSRKEISYALHYFVKDWIDMGYEVKVINISTKYSSIFDCFKKARNSHKSDFTFYLDNVQINRLSIKKIPKIDYFQSSIKDTADKVLKNINKENIPNIIVCHMINPSLYIAQIIKKELKIPIVLTMHQSDLNQIEKMKHRFKRYKNIESSIDRLGFRSGKLKSRFESLNLTSKNNFIIPSGVDNSLVINNDEIKEKIHSQSKIIFVASAMIPLKNIDVLIKAFEKVAKYNDIYLKIAGDGPDKQKLEKMVSNSPAKTKIKFLGYLPRQEVIDHMEKSDIFAMISSPETMGLVYIEAMAKGCITIGTKGEGIDGIIKDNENGYLCEPRNIDALVSKLSMVLNLNELQKEKIVTNAISTAMSMSQKKLSKEYLQALKKVINSFEGG